MEYLITTKQESRRLSVIFRKIKRNCLKINVADNSSCINVYTTVFDNGVNAKGLPLILFSQS